MSGWISVPRGSLSGVSFGGQMGALAFDAGGVYWGDGRTRWKVACDQIRALSTDTLQLPQRPFGSRPVSRCPREDSAHHITSQSGRPWCAECNSAAWMEPIDHVGQDLQRIRLKDSADKLWVFTTTQPLEAVEALVGPAIRALDPSASPSQGQVSGTGGSERDVAQQPPTHWRQAPDGRWQYLAPDGYWYDNPAPGPPPSRSSPVPTQYGAPPSRGTNGMSIASLVLGIVWIWGLGSVLALVFGYVGLRQIKERNETGRGMAIAGVVLGWVGIGGLILFIILIAAVNHASHTCYVNSNGTLVCP
jgi:hypothetical protein